MPRRLLLLIVLLAAACRTAPIPLETRLDSLDRYAPAAMERVQVPGLALAIVDGDNIRVRTWGVANARTGERVNDRTVFEAASLSKPVFAYAVMKLAEEKRIDLDRPLGSYVTQPFAADPRVAAITARIVMTHRTGFPNWRPDGKPLEILFDPGTRFSYSGEGFMYLQRAVEAITNEPFDTFMRRTVFEPLGMTDSSYVWQPAYETQKAWGHDDAGTPTKRQIFETPKSASTLHTTASDLGKFLSAIFQRKGISEQSVREMLRAEVQVPESCAICATLKDPGANSKTIGWGLGWALYSASGHRYLWHWGDNGDFKAFIIADDARKRGAVTLMNGASGLAIAADVVAIAMGDPPGSIAVEQGPLDWAKYDRWDSPAKMALHDILTSGADGVGRLRARADIPEAGINTIGYSLLRAGHKKDAVEVFRLNTQRHPDSWNAWDSLGEGFAAVNEREEAVTAYKKSVELNPENANGKERISKLLK